MLFGQYFYLVHGVVLWLCWGVFALVQIGSARYLKGSYPKTYMTVHTVSGSLITGVTAFFSFYAQYGLNWKILNNAHSYLAYPTLYGSVFVLCLGYMARFMLLNAKWNTRLALTVTSLHRYLGHSVIVLGTFANSTGIYIYRNNTRN